MSTIDAGSSLHHVEHLITARFEARSIPDPIFANIGIILQKILHSRSILYITPNISGCVGRLPANFLRTFWVLILRSRLHHNLISIDIGGEIRSLVKDT